MAIYTVFHEESESEVETKQILEPGMKILENGIPGSNFLSKIFLSIVLGVRVSLQVAICNCFSKRESSLAACQGVPLHFS